MKLNSKTLKQQLNLKGNPEILIKIDNSDEIISIPWEIFFRDVLQLVSGYVPLAGTEVGNPVTGSVQYDGYGLWAIDYLDPNESLTRIGIRLDDGNFAFRGEDTSYFQEFVFGGSLGSFNLNSNKPDFKGFQGSDYFGVNYDENTYVQKKYVDNAMIPLDYGDIVSAGGIENVQVFTTGAGTGIASVDLSPIMAIGKDITVSDLGNNASTHNIQINAGVGNTILYNGTASQDITLSTNGASVTLRKMTATQWMAI